jgi:hypothetical protein
MNRRTSGASLLYAGPAAPARWFRTAATIVDAWGSSLCARQWHASRLGMSPAVLLQSIPSQLGPVHVPVESERTRTRLR